MTARTYDITQHDVIVGGFLITGWAEGAAVTIARETELYSDAVGLDGEVSRSRMHDHRATMTLSLMQTAEANDVLSRLAQQDRDTPGGAGVFDVRVVDRAGTTVAEAAEAWVLQLPELTLEGSPTAREWQLRLANLRITHGSVPREGA